ncbi:hypothetical protein COT40_02040 [Candidatus Peregrinibacteria bacterium CG08_land_8_20_14_0_20_41_10]|nr:MAG: hypothetical protein AUJ78_01755 [Candidatus Peregrinibacteria bacterium CG1_02_41_10]PIS32062.1 MAG: hypothetical protein COT40_02040 [Candidatus Peregrinibacteria bacterium CG08_land_8_20_14_0_20_41_10]
MPTIIPTIKTSRKKNLPASLIRDAFSFTSLIFSAPLIRGTRHAPSGAVVGGFALFLTISLLGFSGCAKSPSEQIQVPIPLPDQVALQLETERVIYHSADSFTVKIILNNPGQISLASVRSWLTYDPLKLEAQRIDTQNSIFEIVTPGENTFNQTQGIVQIGRGALQNINQINSLVAEIIFKVKPLSTETISTLDFYDFTGGINGHTTVATVENGAIKTLLAKPSSPALKLNLLP